MPFERITIDRDICSGKPCIRGTRMPVFQIVDLVAAGNSFERILEDYPDLEHEDIRQALAYAAWLTREDWIAV